MKQAKSVAILLAVALSVATQGCAGKQATKPDFFTSGSKEADQRAQQQVSKIQQMRGKGGDESAQQAKNATKSLYERVGGEAAVRAIVDDFVARVLADPRINFERKGVRSGGALAIRRNSKEWQPTEENVARLKQHMIEFISLASGGPTQYGGRDIRELHKGMKVTNSEFDATVGAFKATLDKVGLATAEQKELISILESTRPQIVEQR